MNARKLKYRVGFANKKCVNPQQCGGPRVHKSSEDRARSERRKRKNVAAIAAA